MTRKTLGLRGIALATMAITALPLAAEAQQIALEEIVVTARKRSESLQEIPVAITAFSSAQMEAIGAPNLVDLAKFTPGLQFNEQGVQEPGRVYTAIRFRGLGSELKEPFAQTGSAFLDGIYMPGGVSSLGNENFERIEVVKGPSSAWLGRSTFAGAVNFITKTPSTEEFSGRASTRFAEDGTYDVTFSHEGPIIEDKLAYRAFVRGYGTSGQYSASDGGELGAERTDTIMGTLYATPTDSLTMKLHAIYSEDKDSSPAQAFISGPLGLRGNNTTGLTNCLDTRTGGAVKADGVTPLTDWVCGKIPEVASIIDSSTAISADLIQFWNEVVPEFPGAPYIDQVGLRRENLRLSLNIDYDLNAGGILEGSTLSFLGGYGKENSVFIRDFDLTPVANWLSRDPSQNKVKQFEARITSSEDNDLTWMLGVSYFDGGFQATFQGGEVAVGTDGGLTGPGSFDLDTALGRAPDGFCPCFFPPLTIGPENGGETKGVFGTIGYQFTDEFSFDFEWRYQKDEITVILPGVTSVDGFAPQIQALATGNGGELGQSFKKFLPRVTLQYQPTDDTNVWATFSRGNTPGYFNADVVNRPAADIDLIFAQIQTDVFLDEETLDNYELGWKQQFLDNRVNFSLVAYYMEWKNQKTRTGATINRNDAEMSQIALNATIGGFNTEFKGIEFEGSAAATENLVFDWGLNYADAEFKNFECGFTDDFFPPAADGRLVCDGNRPVQFPKWSGSIAGTWTDSLTDDWDYFLRWDASYTGKRFADEANFAYVGSQILSNLRIGFSNDDMRIEGFVTNLFNDKTWLAGQRWTDFSADQGGLFPFEFTVQQGIALSAPKLRQFGVRASYNF